MILNKEIAMAELGRRNFLGGVAGSVVSGLAIQSNPVLKAAVTASVPSYLKGYEQQYAANPREAAIEWFRNARFGLFMHYGLYSLLGRHEWVQLREKIPVAEYAKLKEQFTAEKFDANLITDLALAAGMKYVNITTRHHDSFCLFDTRQSDFKSTNSRAKRDLVAELSEQCRKKGLGMFFYYSHGRDWKHPHAPNNDQWGGSARPKYDPPEPSYATGAEHDLGKYVAFMKAQITELLTNYGPVAGIWLDGIGTTKAPKAGSGASTADFHCQELYDHIHAMQPQVLVSYKQGLLGTEDFFAPEHKAIENASGKPMEICTTLQKGGWGYMKDAVHLTPDEVRAALANAAAGPANLLLNTGPLGDGSIHTDDNRTLHEVGRRLREEGWPKPSPASPSARKKRT
jgi:alpha-L-fucosidase